MPGEMENGISIKVANHCFPRKENLVNSQDAATPNMVFTTKAIPVAIKVTFKADNTYSDANDCI